jgi:hypothetical protein
MESPSLGRAREANSGPGVWTNGAGLLVAFLSVAVFFPAPVAGYIDPLSGSIILQVVAAGILAGTLTVRRFWTRIRGFISGLRHRSGGSQ